MMQSKIEIKDNLVIKTFEKDFIFNHMWFILYDEFRDFCINKESRIIPIKVHEVEKNRIVMDYFEGKNLYSFFDPRGNEKDFKDLIYIANNITQLMSNFLEFNYNRDTLYATHFDVGLHNLLLSEDSIALIDPDSFNVHNYYFDLSSIIKCYLNLNEVLVKHGFKIGDVVRKEEQKRFEEYSKTVIRKSVIKEILGEEEFDRKFPGA